MGTEADPIISRRRFIKVAAAATAVAAVPGVAAAERQAPSNRSRFAAPTVVAKPFAGKELVVLGPSYHAPYLPDEFIPTFQDQTGAKVQWLQMPSDQADVKYSAFLVAQDSSVDVLFSWETLNAKFGPVLFEDITGKTNQQLYADVVPAAKAAFVWLKKVYGLPFDSNLTIFMWNKDLYKAAGLDPEKPPESWAQFLDYSKKLSSGGKYATEISPGFFPYAVMINSTSGSALNDDLTKVLADTAESLLAIGAMNDAFTAKTVDPISLSLPDSIAQGKNFRAGRFAHYIAFPNHYTLTMDPTQSQIVGKAATSIIPGVKLRSGTANGIEGYGINRFSKHKDVAMAFLEHTLSPEIQKYVGLKWGRPPARQSILSDPDVLKSSPQFATVLEQAKYTAKRYGSPFYDDLDKLYTEKLLDMVKGSKSPEETAKTIQSGAQKIVDDYWAKQKH